MRRVRGGCLAWNVHRRLGALTAGDVTAGIGTPGDVEATFNSALVRYSVTQCTSLLEDLLQS